jgi:deoxyhypusine synthase
MKNLKAVNHMNIKKRMKVSELIKEMFQSGVMGAGKLAKAVDIFELMIKDKDCKVFFGLAGAMVPGGMKNIVIDLLKNHYIDVFVTTGANLTHDLIEALGYKHYQGSENMNDSELNKKGIDRIYDSFMLNKVYGGLEDFFNKTYDSLKDETNIKDFLWKLGSLLKKNSILKTCYEERIPIFCPAISDSGIGLMMWNNLIKNKKNNVNAFDDLNDILDTAWASKKTGVIYIGGGVPKNYIQQAMQFSKGASYGIQITMDRPEPGGSSGAPLKEGISWGKLKEKARFVNVICDATIALPIVYACVKDRL